MVHETSNGIRQLTICIFLPTGQYCIIPSTEKFDISGNFLLRIYSEVDAHVEYVFFF